MSTVGAEYEIGDGDDLGAVGERDHGGGSVIELGDELAFAWCNEPSADDERSPWSVDRGVEVEVGLGADVADPHGPERAGCRVEAERHRVECDDAV